MACNDCGGNCPPEFILAGDLKVCCNTGINFSEPDENGQITATITQTNGETITGTFTGASPKDCPEFLPTSTGGTVTITETEPGVFNFEVEGGSEPCANPDPCNSFEVRDGCGFVRERPKNINDGVGVPVDTFDISSITEAGNEAFYQLETLTKCNPSNCEPARVDVELHIADLQFQFVNPGWVYDINAQVSVDGGPWNTYAGDRVSTFNTGQTGPTLEDALVGASDFKRRCALPAGTGNCCTIDHRLRVSAVIAGPPWANAAGLGVFGMTTSATCDTANL